MCIRDRPSGGASKPVGHGDPKPLWIAQLGTNCNPSGALHEAGVGKPRMQQDRLSAPRGRGVVDHPSRVCESFEELVARDDPPLDSRIDGAVGGFGPDRASHGT